MKVRTHRVLRDCVERGIEYGYNRAYKHTDAPTAENIKMEIEEAVIHEIYEYFDLTGNEYE